MSPVWPEYTDRNHAAELKRPHHFITQLTLGNAFSFVREKDLRQSIETQGVCHPVRAPATDDFRVRAASKDVSCHKIEQIAASMRRAPRHAEIMPEAYEKF